MTSILQQDIQYLIKITTPYDLKIAEVLIG